MHRKSPQFILYSLLEQFLARYSSSSAPLLLAFSGGADSLALLHLLRMYRKKTKMPFCAIHVDHGWRKNSAEEALTLQKKLASYDVPLYVHRLPPPTTQGNWEEQGRIARMTICLKKWEEDQCQALLTAHQRDDQAETVLKRVLEGAHWARLGGMEEVSTWGKMPLWRPLLTVPKQQLMTFLTELDETWIEDPTNYSPHFLRGRMRTQILPMLEVAFGKNVRDNLCLMAQSSRQLQGHFSLSSEQVVQTAVEGPFGTMIDFSPFPCLSSIEIEAIIQVVASRKRLVLGMAHLRQIATWVYTKKRNASLYVTKAQIHVDAKRLFFLTRPLGLPMPSIGAEDNGPLFHIHIAPYLSTHTTMLPKQGNWRDLWQGHWSGILLDVHQGQWKVPDTALVSVRLGKWWNQHKVPPIFRKAFPIFANDRRLLCELLSGKHIPNMDKENSSNTPKFFMEIKLK